MSFRNITVQFVHTTRLLEHYMKETPEPFKTMNILTIL